DGRALMKAKATARSSKVVESPSQRTLSELAANGARFESAIADTILWKAEACMIAPTARRSAAKASRSRGRILTMVRYDSKPVVGASLKLLFLHSWFPD